MARPPRGIQLGRRSDPALLRTLDLALVGASLFAAWGGVSLFRACTEFARAEAGIPQADPSVREENTEPPEGFDPDLVRQAAVLLDSGVLDAPVFGAILETVEGAAPPGLRITGIEVRPTGEGGRLNADIAAEAASRATAARFLTALVETESVLSTEVISETRQSDGSAAIRITARLESGRPSRR